MANVLGAGVGGSVTPIGVPYATDPETLSWLEAAPSGAVETLDRGQHKRGATRSKGCVASLAYGAP